MQIHEEQPLGTYRGGNSAFSCGVTAADSSTNFFIELTAPFINTSSSGVRGCPVATLSANLRQTRFDFGALMRMAEGEQIG